MINSVLKLGAGGAAALFVLLGLAWWVGPDLAGRLLGMDLLAGVGLSTQLADLASFFLTLGFCILAGLATGRRLWFFPAILLLGLAMIGRIIAWLAHGAALPADMIAVEVAVIALLSALSLRSAAE